MNSRTTTELEILAGRPVDAVVYIWYPCRRFSLGHVSIYVGGVPKCPWPEFDSLDHSNRAASPEEDNYVSFFAEPDIPRGHLSCAGTLNTLQADFVDPPHVKYYLIGLDVEKMRYHAGEIHKGKKYGNFIMSHSYNSINKNCATMVAKILKAGGVENLLSIIQRIGYGKNIYWTPKDIAQLCNELRNNDKAVKVKGLDCPNKLDLPFKTLMGFR
ncbi:hypothetical protein ID858_05505 [Xenorhabdus sp. DI]|uniref:hypothetical protein n=1 Tax=Xenorhabdus doucetiae TaxID=351671 RepID=UPI001988436F|nr:MULTISPECIES: hypothetical protein [unclassified Xenorhabdus]MBD2783191.1 hypothetical protein [Xenorhabdus sp. 3]MBD2787960.1 hypothetical protein [Xenorhabdus sp. DI]